MLLSQLIDDYIAWFTAWHSAALDSDHRLTPPAPESFAEWRRETVRTSPWQQAELEKITALHEQLHTLIRLIGIKAAEAGPTDRKDDDKISAKYLELMQELRRFERALAAAASDLDPLTGLRTRQTLNLDLQKEISRSARSQRPFFVAIMDLDHFKKINDTHGHDNGDRVLAAVADLIIRNLRSHDDAYRIGGEEFLLCIKETDAAGCAHVMERLRTGLESTALQLNNGAELKVTASFGLTLCKTAISVDDLIRKVDQALYRAKNEGRNRIVVGD